MSLRFDPLVILFSIAIGLMGVNVLLVNNYRDVEDDREAGKKTQTVMRGRPITAYAYLLNGYLAMAILAAFWVMIALGKLLPMWTLAVPVLYLVMHTVTWYRLKHRDGAALNPLLGETARNMLIFTILFTIIFIIYS